MPESSQSAPEFVSAAFSLPAETSGQQSLPFRLTGSQAKTAFALRKNCEAMICGNSPRVLRTIEVENKDGERVPVKQWIAEAHENLNCTGFLTLTVGDETPDGFKQVWDSAEASRRINNLNRRVLKEIFERAIVVTERHKNGAIHFHILGIIKGKPDIRTGFDFAAFERAREARAKGNVNKAAEVRYKLATCDALRGLWSMLRDVLPRYGFGRAELTPVRKTGEAVACYVSKYIEKNICNRLASDKRKKLVRYLGDWSVVKTDDDGAITHTEGSGEVFKTRPNDFGWCSKRATAWRCKARELASLIFVQTTADAAKALGPRWAFWLTTTWQSRFGDDLKPFFVWTSWHRRKCTDDLAKISARCGVSNWIQEKEFPDLTTWHAATDDFWETTGRAPRVKASFENECQYIGDDMATPEEKELRAAVIYVMEYFRKEKAEKRKMAEALLN